MIITIAVRRWRHGRQPLHPLLLDGYPSLGCNLLLLDFEGLPSGLFLAGFTEELEEIHMSGKSEKEEPIQELN